MNSDKSKIFESSLDHSEEIKHTRRRLFLKVFITLAIVTIGALVVVYNIIRELNLPPDSFPTNQIVSIEQGTTVRDITAIFEEAGVVKSKHLLYYNLVLFHEPTNLKASNYRFNEPITTSEVATKLTEGDFVTDLISFTHFEGERVSSIATRAAKILPNFNQSRFINNAEPQEGKIFPETYFIPESFTDEDLLTLMLDTFTEQVSEYETEIVNHPLTLHEILVLASIIEREANTPESMKLVSSVLQNRLAIDMPLQADASIEYILDKPLSELTPEDLAIDSPYNTYLYRGLPPTPIGNPGIDSIEAVLRPTDSEYFYYITDDTGSFHFSETYNQHLKNIETYLR